jgi:hypothetical protein
VGKSPEWVKAIETNRLQVPRLPLLLRLAEVLGVEDLADLTGDERLSAASYTKAAHGALSQVRKALTSYQFTLDKEPSPAADLTKRVRHAWELWHAPGDHRSRIAGVLPSLLADAQHAARTLTGDERRRALTALAQTYHLAQLYLAFQPAPELVTLTGDRAMAAAMDADDPHAIAGAAWYLNHVFRSAGERHEARLDLAMRAAELLRPDASQEDLARWGLLQLAAALSSAKTGKRGDAERFWDRADDAARRLGDYVHPWLIFGRGMVDAYAITIKTDLVRRREAVDAASKLDLTRIPSATRRSLHLIESARAYSLQGENVAVVHLLKRACKESPESARFNLFTRSTVADLAETGSPIIREDVRSLAESLGVPA